MLANWGFAAALFLCWFGLSNARDFPANCADDATAFDIAKGVDLTGKVAIITGGDSGLGFSAAEAFAKQGATLIIAGHSPEKSGAVAHNLSVAFGADVRPLALDLANLSSVREFATQFYRQIGGALHFLINDAGTPAANPDSLTMDGFEKLFQINYLGHFLLTELLLPALRKSRSSRIVNVASAAHYKACSALRMPEDCLKDWTLFPPPVIVDKGIRPHPSYYGFSKWAMIQHAAELAKREADNGIMAFAIMPGYVLTPQVQRSPKNYTKICEEIMITQHLCPYTSEQGAAVIAYCAFHANISGALFDRVSTCGEVPGDSHGFKASMRPEFYRRSLEWVGLAQPASHVENVLQKVKNVMEITNAPAPMLRIYIVGAVGALFSMASFLAVFKLSNNQVAVTSPLLIG